MESLDMLLEWLFLAASCLVIVVSALGMRAMAMKGRKKLRWPMNSFLLVPSFRALSGDWSWLFKKDEDETQERQQWRASGGWLGGRSPGRGEG